MIDITLGQYYSVKSKIHELDPRVKIHFTLLYIILLLIDRSLPLYAFLTTVSATVIWMSHVPLRYIVKGTRPIFITIALLSLIEIFTTRGDIIFSIGMVDITIDGLIKAGFVFWRMLLLIVTTSLIMYTTTPAVLTDGLEKAFHLSGSIAMGITIAMRFVPVFFQELDRIMKAQEARGASWHHGSLKKRIMDIKNIIVPLFQGAINKAGNLGTAMDARCYTGGRERTRLRVLKYNGIDILCYFGIIGMTAAAIWLSVGW